MRPLLLLLAATLAAQPDFDALDRETIPDETNEQQVRRARAQMQREVEEVSAKMQAEYAAAQRRMAEQREALRKQVRQQWLDFHESSVKQWVDYSKKGDAYSSVDFEKGKMTVEALVPLEEVEGPDKDKKLRAAAEKKLAEQAKIALPELKDQVRTPQGAPVTEKNVRAFVAPKIKIDPKPVVAEDGKPRVRVTAEADLVPEHLRVRAERHKAKVTEVARKYGLDPALLYAVIHTESFFNPRARSEAPAYGLMQLMQKSGAREAWQYLHKEEKLLSAEELYDPDTNILLGGTYLHMLQSRHFGKVKSPDSDDCGVNRRGA